jgi:hypothetical protein
MSITDNLLAERKNNPRIWKGSQPSRVSSIIYGW